MPLEMMTCERVLPVTLGPGRCPSGVGARHLTAAAWHAFERDKRHGEVALYDRSLNVIASDTWEGACWDAAAVTGRDGEPLLAVIGTQVGREGGGDALCLRLYSLEHGTLALRGSTTWKYDNAEWFETREVAAVSAGEGHDRIAILSLAGGAGGAPGRAAVRIHDLDLSLRSNVEWQPKPGRIQRGGGRLGVLAPRPGSPRMVTAINLDDQGIPRVELRTFDADLRPRRLASRLLRERHAASALAVAELDGRPAIVVAGQAFPEPRLGVTSELLIFDANLRKMRRAEWQTFRQSWVWDVIVADLNGDGRQDIITLGGASMRGADERGAHMFSELRVWDAALRPSDLFIWQTEPGVDTRASRGCLLAGRRPTLVVATSRWAWQQPRQCEVRSFAHAPSASSRRTFTEFARAWQRQRTGILEPCLRARDRTLRALAVDGLATILRTDSIPLIAPVLCGRDRSLARRTVDVLRGFRNAEAVDAARRQGFATPDDWIVVGPFDNANGRGFARAYPPERRFDPKAFYAGRGSIVRWSKVRQEHPDIYVDLAVSDLVPFARTGVEINWNTRRTQAVAYALTDAHCRRRTQAVIRLGRSDAARLWLNGKEVWASSDVRPPAVDDELIPITLRTGRNRIVLKIANTKTDAWGFYLRITDHAGRPIRGLRYQPPEVSATQGDFLSRAELEGLLDDRDRVLRGLAAAELARSGEQAGVAALERLATGRHRRAAAEAALTLAELGERSAANRLAVLAASQPSAFQLEAAHALRRLGDRRWRRFSLDRLRSKTGASLGEFKVEQHRERGFFLKALLQGEEMGNIGITCRKSFHFGDGVSASCSRIDVFGLHANKFRRRGVGAEIIRRGLEMMDQRGDVCSTVATGTGLVAHRLYRRLGYVDRVHSRTLHLDPRRASDISPDDSTISVRQFRAADRPALERLRQVCIERSIGPEPEGRRDRLTRKFGPWIWLASRERRPIGFLAVAEDPFEKRAIVSELATAPDADRETVARALLAAVLRRLRARRWERLEWINSPHSLRTFARALGFATDPRDDLHGWVYMFRVIRLPQLLREIAPLLATRLQRSPCAGWEGTLALKGSRLRATLDTTGGEVRARAGLARDADVVVSLSDDDITSLVCGDCDAWAAYREHRLSTRPAFNERVWRLLEALFPLMEARQGWPDYAW